MANTLMLGNEAVARGLFEAGCAFVSSYPGTPSTEITEYAAEYPEVYAEWAPNEKVAVESAIGASFAGVRAFSAMKHVGLNVAADPLFTASYTGVNAALVIAVADDMGMHSSQNEQDSRHYARAAKIPMLEPSDSAECLEFAKMAFELSERFDTPVLLRLSTRVSHSQSIVETSERKEVQRKGYERNIGKYVMMPAMARVRHVEVEKRQAQIAEADLGDINRIEMGDTKIGVIAAGIAYQYAKEALGDKASYLKLGMVYPFQDSLIKEFAGKVDKLYVIEELDGFIEEHCKALGLDVHGKELFSFIGEYSTEEIRKKILGTEPNSLEKGAEFAGGIPVRPPVLCPGCPHRGTFHVLKKLGLRVSGDIGCYTLGATTPLSTMDLCVCMGASVSALHGMNKAAGDDFSQQTVAVIGDSTFIHSGITGLINIVYNQSPSTVLVLDNSITGMTGHQQNPATGLTLKGESAPVLDIAAVCKAVGIKRVKTVDAHDVDALESILKEELAADEPSVIVVKRPCVLLKSVKRGNPHVIDQQKCKKCRACLRIGCPAISAAGEKKDVTISIDRALCVGCGLCVRMCKFGAISS